jgi:hypothetical protein
MFVATDDETIQPTKGILTQSPAKPMSSSTTATPASTTINPADESPLATNEGSVTTKPVDTVTIHQPQRDANKALAKNWEESLGGGNESDPPGINSFLAKPDLKSDPQFGPLKTSEVNQLWNDPGVQSGSTPSGNLWTDLGNGRVRWTFPNGDRQITGITDSNGNPVIYSKSGENQWWSVDINTTGKNIVNDANVGKSSQPIVSNTFKFNGQDVHFEQYPPGPNGSQYSKLLFPDGKTVDIYSQSQLPQSYLENIAKTINNAPPKTFENTSTIQVFNQLGEVMGPDGKPQPVAGFAGGGDGTIMVTADSVSTPGAAGHVLPHEAGHVLDYNGDSSPQLSSTAVDANGNPLFGQGQYVGKNGIAKISESDYVSEYASRNAMEDFAETHRELITTVRENYSWQNPGKDLFDQPASDVSNFIDSQGYSPAIRNKMMYIAEKYGVTSNPPAAETDNASSTAELMADTSNDTSSLGKLRGIAPIAEKGLGVLGVVGGTMQAANGINELTQGKTLDGSLDTASGVLNAAGGAAMATGVGAVAAPFLFGGGSVVDGVHDIINSNGDGEKLGVGIAKTAGGGMMIAGGVLCATGIGAPVGAALIVGGGIMAGGAALYDTFHNQINEAVSTVANNVGSTVSTVANNVGNAVGSVANAVGNFFSNW